MTILHTCWLLQTGPPGRVQTRSGTMRLVRTICRARWPLAAKLLVLGPGAQRPWPSVRPPRYRPRRCGRAASQRRVAKTRHGDRAGRRNKKRPSCTRARASPLSCSAASPEIRPLRNGEHTARQQRPAHQRVAAQRGQTSTPHFFTFYSRLASKRLDRLDSRKWQNPRTVRAGIGSDAGPSPAGAQSMQAATHHRCKLPSYAYEMILPIRCRSRGMSGGDRRFR